MKQLPRPSRKPAILAEALHKKLNAYAAAASATGVSLVALTQPSEAKIIYTPTLQTIRANGTYSLDLNHDGVVDFLIHEWSWATSRSLLVKERYGNAVQVGRFATALPPGASIGPNQRFASSRGYLGETMVSVWLSSSGQRYVTGPWENVRDRYLGLRFLIKGKTHYGWAKLTVQLVGWVDINATLTGFAYEDVADQPIHAGEGEIPTVNPETPQPTSKVEAPGLGMLALGADGLRYWRRP